MEWVRNHIILTTKHFQYDVRGNEKVCQTFWCRDTIAGHNYNYKQKQQGNPAAVLREAFYENFRGLKWPYICLKHLEAE